MLGSAGLHWTKRSRKPGPGRTSSLAASTEGAPGANSSAVPNTSQRELRRTNESGSTVNPGFSIRRVAASKKRSASPASAPLPSRSIPCCSSGTTNATPRSLTAKSNGMLARGRSPMACRVTKKRVCPRPATGVSAGSGSAAS